MELEEYVTIFQVEKLMPLVEQVEKISPEESKKQVLKKREDVLEI